MFAEVERHILILSAVMFPYAVVESGYCFNVDTSEGPRTLRSGQRACASLDRDEKESNLGRKFVTCVTGNVYTQDCQTGLRLETRMMLLLVYFDAVSCSVY